MSLSAAIIDAMLASGCSAEQMAAAMKASLGEVEAKATARRQKDAERQSRSRASRKSRDVTVTPRDTCDAPSPNEYISNPHPDPVETKVSTPPSLADRVVEAWNEGPARRGATKAQKLDAGRRRSLAARVREHGDEAVFQAIRGIAGSDFHCGIGEKSYRTNLGWLLKSPEHFVAAMERAVAAAPAPQKLNPAEQAESLRNAAKLYRRMGRDDDAADADRRAAMLVGQPPGSSPGRDRGGPARPIAQLVRNLPHVEAA